MSETMARLVAACNGISYFVFSCIAVLFVERLGRRKLMMISTFMQMLAFVFISPLLYYATVKNNTNAAKASVFFFFFYCISFGLGMLGVPWLYPAEVASLPMRTKAAALATASDWM